MPDFFQLITKWKKQIALFVLLSTIIVAIVVFIIPVKFLALTTGLPTNSAAADKSTIFNTNIQELYSALGSPDDADKIIGTARLDTVYLATAIEFNLTTHYKTEEKGESALLKAAHILKDNTKVSKSEYGEIQVRVWDRDKGLAPVLANAIMEKLATIHQNLQLENNRNILQSLKKTRSELQSETDSLRMKAGTSANEKKSMSPIDFEAKAESLKLYDQLMGQYQVMLDTKPAALIIVEKARPANRPDKPRRAMLIVGSFVLSILFSLLMALFLERRKPVS